MLEKLIIVINKLIICTFPSSLPPPHFFHVKQTGKKKGPVGFLASLTLFWVMAHTIYLCLWSH